MAAGILRPDQMVRSEYHIGYVIPLSPPLQKDPNRLTRTRFLVLGIMPTVMAGIIAIYGLVVSLLISSTISSTRPTPLAASMTHFGAGLAVGLSGLAAGFSVGIVGDAGVRATAQQPRMYTGMMLILIFAEVLGLYGMVIGLLMVSAVEMDNAC